MQKAPPGSFRSSITIGITFRPREFFYNLGEFAAPFHETFLLGQGILQGGDALVLLVRLLIVI